MKKQCHRKRQRQATSLGHSIYRLRDGDRGPQKIDSDGLKWSLSQVWAQRDPAADGTEEAQSACWQRKTWRGCQAVAWPGSVIPGERVGHPAASVAVAAAASVAVAAVAAAPAVVALPEGCPVLRGSVETGLPGSLGIPMTAVSS